MESGVCWGVHRNGAFRLTPPPQSNSQVAAMQLLLVAPDNGLAFVASAGLMGLGLQQVTWLHVQGMRARARPHTHTHTHTHTLAPWASGCSR